MPAAKGAKRPATPRAIAKALPGKVAKIERAAEAAHRKIERERITRANKIMNAEKKRFQAAAKRSAVKKAPAKAAPKRKRAAPKA